VERVEDVSSHMAYDEGTGLLYIADTGNNRITVLDTTSGEEGDRLASSEPGVAHNEWVEADYWTLINGEDHGMGQPSGLTLVEDHLLITDHANGNIVAFDLEGNLVDWLGTGMAGIQGIEARSLEDIWVVDSATDRVLRIQP
jgi:hypothetical protein